MNIRFKTDGKPVVIDTENVKQFYAVAIGKSVIEHVKDGEYFIDIVNHSSLKVTQALCRLT